MQRNFLALFRIAVDAVVTLVEIFLGLRFVLRLFGANSATPFVRWIYDVTEPLLGPFAGMFPAPRIEQGMVLEFTTLFAIIAYALAGYLLMLIVDSLSQAAYNSNAEKKQSE